MGNITSLKENKTLFIPCDCQSEILAIIYDHELKVADFAIYETVASFKNKLSLWQKLRYCWQIVVNNKPYADQILLTRKQLNDLKSFLSLLDL